MPSVEAFSRRISRRQFVWWGQPRRSLSLRAWADAFHRQWERHTFRSRHDPDARWRCCAPWPRALLNKWNSREFAARYGVRIPELYWHGPRLAALPLDELPDAFVIRPTWGTGRRGVHVLVDGVDLLTHEATSSRSLQHAVRWAPPQVFSLADRILIEAFVSSGGSRRLPVEYKCHTFAGTVGVVEVMERTAAMTATHGFYTTGWKPIDDEMNPFMPRAPIQPKPSHLDEMVAMAARLGSAVGTYMRIDFFMADSGCVFNEFSSTPRGNNSYTPYCDALYGELWARHCPDAT